ncbi:MAG: hypothetical protein ACRD12_16190 [Acidimicrobiales bacterium]
MGKPRSIETGDDRAGARVEYIRSRRILRLGGWHDRDKAVTPVEVPAGRFLADLGIDPVELGAAPLYVLVAGLREPPRGTLRHVVLAFPSELDARHRFRLLRSRHQHPDEWARLVTVDARCQVTPLCWFGEGAVEGGSVAEAPPVRRRWPPRRRSRMG